MRRQLSVLPCTYRFSPFILCVVCNSFFATGGSGPNDPYRCLVDRSPGGPRGWRDTFTFYAFASAVPGTVPFYVMHAGGGTSVYDRHRSEITSNPTPARGWKLGFSFFAYPSAAPAGLPPYSGGASAPPYPGGAPPSYNEATGRKGGAPVAAAAVGVPVQQTTVHTTVHHHHHSGPTLSSAMGFLSAVGGAANQMLNYTIGASTQNIVYVSHTGCAPAPGPHRYRISNLRNNPGWMDIFALRIFASSHGNTMSVYVSQAGES